MSESRSVPFVVFADLAFFLFSVLVMGYQYVQLAEAQEIQSRFEVRLPQLDDQFEAMSTSSLSHEAAFELVLQSDGRILLDGVEVESVQLGRELEIRQTAACRLWIDRQAASERLVEVLGWLSRHPPARVDIEYLTRDAS